MLDWTCLNSIKFFSYLNSAMIQILSQFLHIFKNIPNRNYIRDNKIYSSPFRPTFVLSRTTYRAANFHSRIRDNYRNWQYRPIYEQETCSSPPIQSWMINPHDEMTVTVLFTIKSSSHWYPSPFAKVIAHRIISVARINRALNDRDVTKYVTAA